MPRNLVLRPDGKLVNVARKQGQLFICATGCCCGHTERKFAAVPTELYHNEWERRKLRNKVHLTMAGCLGPCPLANIVLLLFDAHHIWFHSINSESQVLALYDYIEQMLAANSYLPPSADLSIYTFTSFVWDGHQPGEEKTPILARPSLSVPGSAQPAILFLSYADTDLLTIRAGRNAPGLVCVVFNWARPRDLSHYEQFEHYHATFYQQVEALSVTPFAPRAIDRGLAALLVSYVRLLGSEFNENSQAGKVIGTHPYFITAIDDLSRRAAYITRSEEVGATIRATLEGLRDEWLEKTRTNVGTQLGYKTRKDGQTVGLLRQPGQRDWAPFTCLNSLRDVEPSINLILNERELDDTIEDGSNKSEEEL